MWPHNLSSGTTLHNIASSPHQVTIEQKHAQCYLSKSVSWSSAYDAFLFYQICFTHLSKNSSNIPSSWDLPKYPWIEFVIQLYTHSVPNYAKIYTFQNPLLDCAFINSQNHTSLYSLTPVQYLTQKCSIKAW